MTPGLAWPVPKFSVFWGLRDFLSRPQGVALFGKLALLCNRRVATSAIFCCSYGALPPGLWACCAPYVIPGLRPLFLFCCGPGFPLWGSSASWPAAKFRTFVSIWRPSSSSASRASQTGCFSLPSDSTTVTRAVPARPCAFPPLRRTPQIPKLDTILLQTIGGCAGSCCCRDFIAGCAKLTACLP